MDVLLLFPIDPLTSQEEETIRKETGAEGNVFLPPSAGKGTLSLVRLVFPSASFLPEGRKDSLAVLKDITDQTEYPGNKEIQEDFLSGEEDARLGRSYRVPLPVFGEIARKGLYFLPRLAVGMHPHRYLHSLSVASTAAALASSNGLDPRIAYLAGLFHDSAKDWPLEKQREIVFSFFPLYKEVPDFALHQFASLYRARTEFGLVDEDVLSAMEFHCTGKGEMTKMQMVLYVADKAEPTRKFPTEKIREIAGKDILEGLKAVLSEQVSFFEKEHTDYLTDPLTRAFYESYGPKDSH
jgi:predicted HD superfamily hydrolase involved in NAD metabolism